MIHHDDRGTFREVIRADIKQINQSFSKKGTVRGLHYQEPFVTKWVWVPFGKIYDVRMDLETGAVEERVIDSTAQNIFEIPKGYAHGFQALEDSIVCYAMDGEYNPAGDFGCNPLTINWPLPITHISTKDKEAKEWSY